MNDDIKQKLIEQLTKTKPVPARSALERTYPARKLPEGAEVTRLCPSPTGFMHIGTVFMALIDKFIADQSAGVSMLRIEDTDRKRNIEGAKELIASQLHVFGVAPDEGLQIDGTQKGNYGPYVQSERWELYMAFALELLENGRAYPCFASSEELQAAVRDQQAKKLRPGYYGEWALWRDRSGADIEAALDSGKPFVLRFKSFGSHDKRVSFYDAIKGTLEFPENDLDVPLIKSDEWRLPTYHLAHVVDDYLMRATIILRGEEWMPSTPLHLELCDALHIPRFRYGHAPVISIIDPQGGGKRKLSKRKDPEADVAFWLKSAYPIKSVKAYLLGLANSNFEEWYGENPDADLTEFPFSLDRLKTSRSPLLDMKKLEDYAKNEISRMPQEHFNKEILAWAELHDPTLFSAMMKDTEYTKSVLAIERDGEKPRKDVAKWSDAVEQFGYFYDDIFVLNILPSAICELDERVSAQDRLDACAQFIKTYQSTADKDIWFENMKRAAQAAGYALDRKELKENPEKFKGGLADFAAIIRVSLTGKSHTPDLWTIMQVMGEQRVKNRLTS